MVVLSGCETWSLPLREEHRLKVFENRAVREIFGAKRDEVTGKWRKIHNDELYDLHFSPYIVRVITSRRMIWAGHVAGVGEREREREDVYTGFWWGKLRERENLVVDGRVMLQWILKECEEGNG